jgi:predicted nucleic acid binding AN1-type Zn finger protein
VRCSACKRDFCGSHFAATAHACTAPNDRNARPVPVCPLCDKPVAPKNADERTASPDALVSAHLDRDCKEAKERRARCVVCKKKELVPIQCNDCGKSVCLKHRYTKVQ